MKVFDIFYLLFEQDLPFLAVIHYRTKGDGPSPTLGNWVLDLLTNRPQTVGIHSSSITVSTGVPQGCMSRPLLFTLLTYSCSARHCCCRVVEQCEEPPTRLTKWTT